MTPWFQETRHFRAAKAGDPRARAEIVEHHLPLARLLARRYRLSTESLEDVEQVACLALVRAVDAFDPTRGTAFATYAVPCILGAIKRYFRDHTWAVRVPRAVQELALRVERIDEQHLATEGRHATAAEAAAAAGVEVEAVLEARVACGARYSNSLDAPAHADDEGDLSLLDTLGRPDPALQGAVERVSLTTALKRLPAREQAVVRLYYQDDLTQAEIGERLGYSQMHISRILRRTIKRLRILAEEPPATQLGRTAA